MDRIRQALFTLIRKTYAQFLPAVESARAHLIEAEDHGVRDGVDYSRPVIVPGWERRQMAAGVPQVGAAVAHRLQEAAADYQSQFGDPHNQNPPITPVTEDPLLEWNWSTRERVLSNCHAAYARNPLANSIVQFTTQFVVGDGFNLSTQNKEVEQILQAFIDNPDNAIREYERLAVNDLQVDGELLVQLFTQNGETVIAPRRPWELRDITTERGFFRRIESFHFVRHETEGDAPTGAQETVDEPIPADQMLFIAINRHSYELRGRPELYRLLPWLRADTEWLSDRARQSKWRNALLWIVKVAGNPSAVGAILQQWRKPPAPGSAYVSSDKVTVEAATNSANAGDATNDGRAIRLMSVMGARLPEYFFGDGSMTNLATATKQELPALTKFETFQQILISQLWTPLFKRVLQNALDAGHLPEQMEVQDAEGEMIADKEPLDTLEAFSVTYEPVTQQDINVLTQALNLQKMNHWIDDISAMEKLGNDPHIVQKRLAEQMAQQRDEMAQGLRPIPPGMEQAMGEPVAGEDEGEMMKSKGSSAQQKAA